LKQWVSIGLLCLLLYHILRAPLLLLSLEHCHAHATAATSGDEWKVVKIPLELPYPVYVEETQEKPGLIEANGQFYNIVSQKLQQDTLITTLKTNLAARERFFMAVEDLKSVFDQSSQKSGANDLLKLFSQLAKVYLGGGESLLPPLSLYLLPSPSLISDCQTSWQSLVLEAVSPPPRY
jgi:hypothetical protein